MNGAIADQQTTTAGLRGAYWNPQRLPPGVYSECCPLLAEDGAASFGILSRRGSESCVVMKMHPREFLPCHYLAPELLRGGYASWSQAPRLIGNDVRLEHESAVLDVAAGVRMLRDRGFDKIILLGNSGGAGLYSLYCQQSNIAADKRIVSTPAGKPTKLPGADLPHIDGLILVSPHPGQGRLLMNSLDPSVTDELDPLSTDPALSPFNPENGFRKPPQSSHYPEEFVGRYRRAQEDRVCRIDEWALGCVERRMQAKQRLRRGQNVEDLALASHTPVMTIWRTDADLRCFDLSLDPSDRNYGSLWGANPYVSNFGCIGFARVCTPDSWLSTWSGRYSNASLEKTAKDISQPTLMVEYTGDNSVFPEDAEKVFRGIGAKDKVRLKFRGDHHGRPLRDGDLDERPEAGQAITVWLDSRFN